MKIILDVSKLQSKDDVLELQFTGAEVDLVKKVAAGTFARLINRLPLKLQVVPKGKPEAPG